MFKDLIKETSGINIYPVISLCVFVAFFIGLSIYTILAKNDFLNEMGKYPLNDSLTRKNENDQA